MLAVTDAGGQVFLAADVQPEYQHDSYKWKLSTTVGEFEAGWLLDCTGRRGVLARLGFGGTFTQLQDYVSIFCLFQSAKDTDSDARTYVEACPNGWLYSALMPSGLRVVAFLTDRDLLNVDEDHTSKLLLQLEQTSLIGHILKTNAYRPVNQAVKIDASSGRYQFLCGPNWMLVGDAAMTFDPLSGWGSTKALVSAATAVQTVLHGKDYQATCDELWENYAVLYRDYYLAERRWSEQPFWSRRHRVIEV